MASRLILRWLGRREFAPVLTAMRAFTEQRDRQVADELWVLEHTPVYTLGQAGRHAHIIGDTGSVPVIVTDRGGQVTYHGPGQLVMYTLLDLRRLDVGVRALVRALESSVIAVLDGYGVVGTTRDGAPGVYVGGAKIAALGLRVRRGCTYHGLSLNVDVDLAPFAQIDPCGYPQLPVTRLRDLGVTAGPRAVAVRLADELARELGYNACLEHAEAPATLTTGVSVPLE